MCTLLLLNWLMKSLINLYFCLRNVHIVKLKLSHIVSRAFNSKWPKGCSISGVQVDKMVATVS